MTPRPICLAALIACALLAHVRALADDTTLNAKLNLGKSILELGGTTGSLIWSESKSNVALSIKPGDELYQMAIRVQTDLDKAKASSSFGRAVGETGAAAFDFAAAVDPEPTSKISFMFGAYVTRASANYLANATYEVVEERSLGVLRNALEDRQNKLTPDKLQAMTKEELVARIDSLRLGNQTMREVFKDNPAALEMVKDSVNDFLVSNSAATLFAVKKIDGNVESMKRLVVKTASDLSAFRAESTQRFQSIEDKTDAVLKATQASSEQLAKLREETKGNLRAIQSLSDISYLGWSTEQKLAALDSGQFPELKGKAREKLIASLNSDKRREETIADLQLVSRDLSSLTTLATNLGMPRQIVTALNVSNTVANGLIRFESGDVLGSLASLSTLFGGGRADPAAERHKQLMNYLAAQFGEVNQRLDRIEKLQQKTLAAVAELGQFMVDFRREIHQQLTDLENQVLLGNAILGNVIREEWRPCRAMRAASNDLPWFTSREEIVRALGASDDANDFRANWTACRIQSYAFLKGDIMTDNWSGSVADMRTISTESSKPEAQKALNRYADIRVAEYSVARDVLLAVAPDLFSAPARYLIQLGQPSASVAARDALKASVSANRAVVDAFTCNSAEILNAGLRSLTCRGIASGSNQPPLPDRVQKMFGDTLIGPNGWGLMDSMIAVSRTATFTWTDGAEQYRFLSPKDLDVKAPPTEHLKAAATERHGLDLLQAMAPMAELNILQQSVAYGDLVPQLVLDILYDPKTRTLVSQVDQQGAPDVILKQRVALKAMQLNPILGRNVVMLAVRKALADADGTFPTTYYRLAIDNFRGSPACAQDAVARRKLADLFPGWKLEYRVEKAALVSEELAECKAGDEDVSRGVGLVLDFGGFYVRMPSTEVATEGVFEYPQSLAIALRYRYKIGQELMDRNVSDYFNDLRMKADFLDVASQLN